jgi:hypothetical protein
MSSPRLSLPPISPRISLGGPQAGVCRFCGCDDAHACEGGCFWVDGERTVCSGCVDLLDYGGWGSG